MKSTPLRLDLVSVVLPTFNEAENIVPLISEIRAVLADTPLEFLVVDDNSPDRTGEIARTHFEGDPAVKVFVRPDDPSLGKAIRRGVEESSGDAIVVMDTDFNHQPAYLPILLQNLRFYDCVMASRFLYGGRMDTRTRHLMSWAYNIFNRVATGGLISDSLYGFFAIRRATIELVDFDATFWGYGDYCIRMLHQLQKKQARILQIPAVNGRRRAGEAKGHFLGVLRQYAVATAKLAWAERRGHVQDD